MAGAGLPSTEPGLAGVGRPAKRARDPPNGKDPHGSVGAFAAEKKPTFQSRSNNKYQKKAENVPVPSNIDNTSKIEGLHMHGVHVSQSPPDSNALSSQHKVGSSPGEDMKNRPRKSTKCIYYSQGRCKNGKSCIFLHEGEVSGSDNRGIGNRRGTGEGFEIHPLSNSKEPRFRNSAGSSRTLVHGYGDDYKGLTHPHMLRVPQGFKADDSWSTKPINEVIQLPIVQEKNYGPYFMGHQNILNTNSCLDDRGAYSRLHPDGGKMEEMKHLKPDYQYQLFDSTISFDPHKYSKISSAYGGATEKDDPYSFRNPGCKSSDYTLINQSLRATSHPGSLLLHQLTPDKDASHHKDVDFDKGGASRSTLPVSSSSQPVVASAEKLSPIKDEVWITSVPFVPSFNFPDLPGSNSPSKSQYDPLVDSIDPPKVESLHNLKSSNICCTISTQHGGRNVIRGGSLEKPLTRADKLARNVSAKGSNEFTALISSDRGHSSSLDGDKRAKACERKNDASLNTEKSDFRFHLVEHVKELVKPIWKEGNLSKDAHKLIVKKSVDKIFASIEPNQIPETEKAITTYITSSGPKIEKLVKVSWETLHLRFQLSQWKAEMGHRNVLLSQRPWYKAQPQA
uniref:C3H1-type domain-containing protein n=1 Tax=Leersia perrieri TaxID=77586 RepID=A0A0D9WI75_9ORYZ